MLEPEDFPGGRKREGCVVTVSYLQSLDYGTSLLG